MKTYSEIESHLSLFVKELVQSESRFRFHDVGNDFFNDKKFFVVTKEIIHCPIFMPAIEHEIAHAVEMRDCSRWLLPDWGMTNFTEPSPKAMFAAMAREIRVRAIQLHMLPESEHNNKNSTLVNILNNDWAWGHWARTMTPFGRFKNYQDVWTWANDLRERTFKSWSQDRIAHEWKIRLTHMQNWMETKN